MADYQFDLVRGEGAEREAVGTITASSLDAAVYEAEWAGYVVVTIEGRECTLVVD